MLLQRYRADTAAEYKYIRESALMALKTGALIIAADNKKREKPIYMCEALSLPLISYVKSYAEKADAEKRQL